MVGKISPNYFPKNLKDANNRLNKSDKISRLYYKGDFNKDIFKRCIAVVGSRKATSYGKKMCRQLVYELASYGITIVSGFMYGIDSYAHEAALEADGKTIAVLGYGINKDPPDYQKKLYNKILESGSLVLSEYKGKMDAEKWTFYKRNRIVAGLSKATLVIEAKKNSGTLVTADYTLKIKRDVYTLVGSSLSKNYIWIAKREGKIVRDSQDVLAIFN